MAFIVRNTSIHCYLHSFLIRGPPKFHVCRKMSVHPDPGQVLSQMTSKNPFILDLTLGAGFTSRNILSNSDAQILAVDCDPICSDIILQLKSDFGDRFNGHICKWSELPNLLNEEGSKVPICDAILLDTGPSIMQREHVDRGFNCKTGGRLDMRYNSEGLDCEGLLKFIDQDSLSRILRTYGEVLKAKTVARDILERRFMMEEIKTTDHLLKVLQEGHERDEYWQGMGESSIDENIGKVLLALRMFLNNEVNETEYALNLAEMVLKQGGLLAFAVSSETEKNSLHKFLFRKAATLDANDDNSEPVVRRAWEEVQLREDCDGKQFLLFKRC